MGSVDSKNQKTLCEGGAFSIFVLQESYKGSHQDFLNSKVERLSPNWGLKDQIQAGTQQSKMRSNSAKTLTKNLVKQTNV